MSGREQVQRLFKIWRGEMIKEINSDRRDFLRVGIVTAAAEFVIAREVHAQSSNATPARASAPLGMNASLGSRHRARRIARLPRKLLTRPKNSAPHSATVLNYGTRPNWTIVCLGYSKT